MDTSLLQDTSPWEQLYNTVTSVTDTSTTRLPLYYGHLSITDTSTDV